MSSSTVSAMDIHAIQNTSINIAPGIHLSELQRKHVGLVLDLFQAKGTMAKLEDNLTDDAVYEDLFATCKNRKEVAGQMLGLPMVTQSSETLSHQVTELIPSSTTTRGNGSTVLADEIHVKVHHRFTFKLGGKEVDMHTVLILFSSQEEGKIVRIQDRPMDHIPDNSILTAVRKLNALAAPTFVGIPSDANEDATKMAQYQT